MANIKSFPNNQDEYIGAEHVMKWLHGRTSGVFGASGNAAVTAVADSMKVKVSAGHGWISNDKGDGIVWWLDNSVTLTVSMADATLPRIDRVVVSWQTTNYVALPEVTILKGTPKSKPVAPALTNDETLRQISLASIKIPAGATAITSSMITDERLDESVCGLVTAGIGVDTSMMQMQFSGAYNEFLTYINNQQARWETFFASVQGDILVPVPTTADSGKVLAVNVTCDGYELKKNRQVIMTQIQASKWNGSGSSSSGGALPPYVCTINVTGITGENTPHITPIYSGSTDQKIAQKEAWGMISDAETEEGTITFTCFESKPEIDIAIQIEVIR